MCAYTHILLNWYTYLQYPHILGVFVHIFNKVLYLYYQKKKYPHFFSFQKIVLGKEIAFRVVMILVITKGFKVEQTMRQRLISKKTAHLTSISWNKLTRISMITINNTPSDHGLCYLSCLSSYWYVAWDKPSENIERKSQRLSFNHPKLA